MGIHISVSLESGDLPSATSLGLHISPEIVALHGDDITVGFPIDGGCIKGFG
jgi:hypothetical protein